MKTNPLSKKVLSLYALCLGLAVPHLPATPASWTNGAMTNAYETPGNWDINQVPNNNSFDVTIGIAAPCNLSSGFQINSLNLAVNTAQLNLVPGSILAFTSNVTNNGSILVNTTAGAATTVLRFDGGGGL